MICPNCGSENEMGSLKCQLCDFNLKKKNFHRFLLDIFVYLFYGGFTSLVGLVLISTCMPIFLSRPISFANVFVLPFMTCGVAIIIQGLSIILRGFFEQNNTSLKVDDVSKNEKRYFIVTKMTKLSSLMYMISFFSLWFGFLIVFDYQIIKECLFFLLLFTIPFWIAGIYFLISNFKK